MNLKTSALLLLVGSIGFLGGCGWFERGLATATGFSRMCVDGVEYLQFTSGATVAWTVDGKIKTCR